MATYRRDEVKAPRMSGLPLRTFVAAIESPVGGPLLDKLLRDSGIDRFRATSADDASPMQMPLPVPDPEPTSAPPLELCAQAVAGAPREFDARLETVASYARAYAGGADPRDVIARLETAIRRFDVDEKMAFFIARKPDEVQQEAEASALRWKKGASLSPLDGVPVVVKNELDVKGYATTLGTKFLTTPATSDSTVVARLRAAGAIMLGKANMNEIGINPIGVNPHWGACRNPHDRTRITGGSSSASAATVAAGLCPISIGADGGGSIRIPAALCGVVGLKATHGRIPETGVPALCWNVGHAGPFGLTVADCAAAYGAIAGRDDHDVASWSQPAPSLDAIFDRSLRGVRIGICTPYFEDAEPDVVARCREARKACEDAGAVVVEIEAPDLNTLLWAHSIIILSEMRTAMLPHLQRDSTRFGLDSRTNLALASRFSSVDLVHAMRHRHLFTKQVLEQLRSVDVIMTPTTAMTAPPVPEHALPAGESNLPVVDQLMRFIRLGNLTGLPAISVPVGVDRHALPVGAHFLARPWEEHLLLRLAFVVEGAMPHVVPRLHTQALRA